MGKLPSSKRPVARGSASFYDEDEDTADDGGTLVPVTAIGSVQPDQRGALITSQHVVCATHDEFEREISRLWTAANTTFLEIGRYLIEAKRDVDHGEFQTWVEEKLPFAYRTAHKLMSVAEAIDTGVFPATVELPPSYTTVYEITTLKPDEWKAAIDQNLLRPDTTREMVLAFKKQFRAPKERRPVTSAAAIRKRLAKLREERRVLDDEIKTLALSLGEIDA